MWQIASKKTNGGRDFCLEIGNREYWDYFAGLTHWPLGNLNEILHIIFKWILVIDVWGISCEIALIWMSPYFTDDQSTLVQVMAWCHQATSHYLSQCWPRSLSPYGVTRPKWVKSRHWLIWCRWNYTVNWFEEKCLIFLHLPLLGWRVLLLWSALSVCPSAPQMLIQTKKQRNHQSCTLLALCTVNPLVMGGFSAQRASNAISASLTWSWSHKILSTWYIDGLMQERRNYIANALELRFSCINPSIYSV